MAGHGFIQRPVRTLQKPCDLPAPAVGRSTRLIQPLQLAFLHPGSWQRPAVMIGLLMEANAEKRECGRANRIACRSIVFTPQSLPRALSSRRLTNATKPWYFARE